MITVDHDLLVRSIGNEVSAIFVFVVCVLFSVPIFRAVRLRQWAYFGTLEGFAIAAFWIKNAGDVIRTAWTWWAQMYRIYGQEPEFGAVVVFFGGYVAPLLTIVGCAMLAGRIVPGRWMLRGAIAVTLGTLAIVAATYAPLIGRVALRF